MKMKEIIRENTCWTADPSSLFFSLPLLPALKYSLSKRELACAGIEFLSVEKAVEKRATKTQRQSGMVVA